MNRKASRFTALVLSAALCVGACSVVTSAAPLSTTDAVATKTGTAISDSAISTGNLKNIKYNNPISSEHFCADPTAVEYNGRLYVFGTNDHQQYDAKGADADNTYEKIKSLVILSTDDMVNWEYHGEINVGAVAPWITNSWAPSVTSRVEADGLTHFYLYFSNNGMGVGVITATDPLGPWSDPLGKPLITPSTSGLTNCPNPFDPGVVIDENGDGWLSFGGGKASGGTDYMPGSARIVKLGDDMLSFDSAFAEIPAPYFFEASELNYINGTYVYTYNTDWTDHSLKWDYDCNVPTGCSMVYMTSQTPLDATSWEMRGECFMNPGMAGFDYSNNHTHMQKYQGTYYMLYHTLSLKSSMGIAGGYRSLCVDTINVDESTVTIEKTGGTKKGVSASQSVNPFKDNAAATVNNTADTSFDTTDMAAPLVRSDKAGAWVSVKDVTFTEGAQTEEPDTPLTYSLTGVDSIAYNITVTAVDKNTTVSMFPSTKPGGDCAGTVDVTGTGNYVITCDLGGATKMQNMGFFTASDDAQITFVIDSMTINGAYEFDLSIELTNTREWADGLKNIWNGFSDGDTVYTSDFASFKYIKADDAIEFFAAPIAGGSGGSSAPLLSVPATFLGKVKGTGRVEVRLDSPTGELLTSIDFASPSAFQTISNSRVAAVGGTHDLYFVFSAANLVFDSWTFALDSSATLSGDVNADGVVNVSDAVMLQKYLLRRGTLTLWKNGDLNADSRINALDLCLLKQALCKK